MRFSRFEKDAWKQGAPAPVREGPRGLVWHPAGASVNVGGVRISGGLLYLSDSRTSAAGFAGIIEAGLSVGSSRRSVLRPELELERPAPYRELDEDARARYLQWLADGRDDPGVGPAFVLNYFCGLERRAFHLMKGEETPEELRSVADEIRKLAARYADHEVLARCSEGLLRALEAVRTGAREQWTFAGGPLPGQGTYEALHRAGVRVHYGAPVPPSPTSSHSQGTPETSGEVRTEEDPDTGDGFLDPELLATKAEGAAATDRLLGSIFEEDDDEPAEPTPFGPAVSREPAAQEGGGRFLLPRPLRLLLLRLADQGECGRGEAVDRARELGLMLDAALTEINEFAEERCDAEVVYEDEGLVVVDTQVFEELDLPAVEADTTPKSLPAPGPTSAPEPAPAPEPVTPSEGVPEVGAARVGPPRWISSIETVHVQGRSISDGMFYYGVPADREARLEVVDPTLPADTRPERRFAQNGTVAYADLPPGDRGEFLDWLRTGRPVSSAHESFLFLLLHGLEHRALVDLKPHRGHRDELVELHSHVSFLISAHSSHEGFVRSAESFAAVLERLVMHEKDVSAVPSTGRGGKMSQQVLQFKLGMHACTGRSLPLELVVLWVRTHPFTAKDPEVQWTKEFHGAFREHFVQTLPKGLRLPETLPDLQWSYRPAHPYLGVFPVPTGGAKLAWDHFPTLQTLGMISRKALYDCTGSETAPPAASQKQTGQAQRPGTPPVERPKPLPAPDPQPEPQPETAIQPAVPRQADAAPRRWSTWKSPGTEVSIGGISIPDGMLYTGYGPGEETAAPDLESASSLDINCTVERPASEEVGAVSDKVRAYAELSPQQRWHYLWWLRNRRRPQGIPPVFVRLYLQGVERRLVDVVGKRNSRIQTSNPVLAELNRLRSGFADHPRIVAYVDGLLTLIGTVQSQPPGTPPSFASDVRGTPFSLLHGLGAMAAAGNPLPVDWAAEWVAHHVRPEHPELFRDRAKRALAGASLPQRMDLEVPQRLPDLVFTYRPRCPGLDELDVVLDGVPDLTGVEPPRKLVDRLPPAPPSTTPNTSVQPGTPVKKASAIPERGSAPGTAPKEAPGWQGAQPWMPAWARLAVEMSRHSGEMTARHRIAVVRGVQELGDVPLTPVRQWKLHHMEGDGADPEAQVRALVNVGLRQRERAADLLLDLLDLSDFATPEQLSFLLAVHQGLGLDAVLRMRLSYRGLAPDPAGNGAVSVTWKPHRSTRHRTAVPARLSGLSPIQARLLADLGQTPAWSPGDVERLTAWYGMEAYSTLRILNGVSAELVGTDVFVRHGDAVTVRVERVKEMTT